MSHTGNLKCQNSIAPICRVIQLLYTPRRTFDSKIIHKTSCEFYLIQSFGVLSYPWDGQDLFKNRIENLVSICLIPVKPPRRSFFL